MSQKASLALLLVAIAATAADGAGQQPGHDTLPTSGPAAPGGFPASARAEDPALARIEAMRRDLAELAKAYKKSAKGPAKANRRPEVLAALGRAEAEVRAAREILAAP